MCMVKIVYIPIIVILSKIFMNGLFGKILNSYFGDFYQNKSRFLNNFSLPFMFTQNTYMFYVNLFKIDLVV